MNARAISNNDIAYIQWSYDAKIPKCLGFSIHRIDLADNQSTPLPTWVGFKAVPNAKREARNSDIWPIQKFQWKDLTAPRGGHYQYRIIPMVGTPSNLKPENNLEQTTNDVWLAPRQGDISVYFNRGIISTQAVTAQLPKGPSGKPQPAVLRERIDQPGDPLRDRLAGDLDEALLNLLERAEAENGACYCALYELNDVKLVETLLDVKRVHIVLSNAGVDDDTNLAARQTLHDANKDLTDRMLAGGHIGHNKFMVYVDSNGTPKAVLGGSTNWTATGLCTQTNNAIIVESETLAKQYLDYWKALKQDDAEQGTAFRTRNQQALPSVRLPGGQGEIQAWFSPNTKQKTKPGKNPPTPADMQEVFDLIGGAERGVLFLAFIPGTPSIVSEIKKVYNAKGKAGKRLFVRGAATDQTAINDFEVDLFHRTARPDAKVTSVAGIQDQFSYWQAELYKLGHAVIHDKIVVVDPFRANCAVVTGSHNLGFKASYANDENLMIIRGNRRVAEAYAAHVLDVYDHFRWRYRLQEAKSARREQKAWEDLDETDGWQDKYFDAADPASADVQFWS